MPCDAALVNDTVEIRYAKGLRIEYGSDGIHVFVSDPDPNSRSTEEQEIVVTEPASRFVCTTALQLGNFEALGLEHLVVGINSLHNLFSSAVKEQLERGETVQIGREGVFDVEKVIALHPDYILVSASKNGGYDALRDCGITLVPHHGYKETHPLGQAEWIKLIGLLTGEIGKANAIFADIEAEYNALCSLVSQCGEPRPTVASGRQLRDGWYAVGGRSYMSQIFRDAGAMYVMADNRSSGGVTMDFEAGFAISHDADFWQTDGSFAKEFTLEDLQSEDARYGTMLAFKKKQVLFCNFAETPYRELAGVEPQAVLADFVKAFHPTLMKSYEPKYYMFLK